MRKGFGGFGRTGKSAQVSVWVAAFSWRRREEVKEAAKMLSPCLLHGRQPSPSEDLLLHLRPGVRATLGQLHLAQEQRETCRFPETGSCKIHPGAGSSPETPTKPAGLGPGLAAQPNCSVWRWMRLVKGAGASAVTCCSPGRDLAMLQGDTSMASAPKHHTSAVTDYAKTN